MPEFPWDQLKAETLRAICIDLGLSVRTREPMLALFEIVQESGLESALEYQKQLEEAKKAVQSPPESPSIRRGAVVSDYDTRHKRKRISDPGPRLSKRKSAQNLATASDEPPPKRRGRPPKPKPKAAPKKAAAVPLSSTRRQIFDGVVLSAPRPNALKGKGKAPEEEYGDDDAEGDVDMEALEDGGLISDIRVESSLASSNKENESLHDGSVRGDVSEEDQQLIDEPARDNIESAQLTRVQESAVVLQTDVHVEVAMDPADECVGGDNLGAVETEGVPPSPKEVMSMSETHQTFIEGQLTLEDLSNIEEVLSRAVATNGF